MGALPIPSLVRRCLAAPAAAIAFVALISACSSDPGAASTSGAGGSTGATTTSAGGSTAGAGGAVGTGGHGTGGTAEVPPEHRPTAEACTADRPPGNPQPAQAGDECEKDADCSAGVNGRCIGLGGPNHCSYDECQSDADCSAPELCDCRSVFGANVCVPADCHVDADCGPGGYCSPGIGYDEPGCVDFGYHCHHPGDSCLSDLDCHQGEPTTYCFYANDGSWGCSEYYCGFD